jgi:hypothetical protein
MTTSFPKNNNDSKNLQKFRIIKRIQNSTAVYCICNLLVVIIITVSKLPLYTVIAGYYVMPTNTSLWGTHCHSNISPLHSFYNINDGQPLKSSSKQELHSCTIGISGKTSIREPMPFSHQIDIKLTSELELFVWYYIWYH